MIYFLSLSQGEEPHFGTLGVQFAIRNLKRTQKSDKNIYLSSLIERTFLNRRMSRYRHLIRRLLIWYKFSGVTQQPKAI